MLTTIVENDEIRFGDRFRVSFQRTLRIPDDEGEYPLPPGLGRFPIRRVEDYPDRVPETWLERGGVFIPMYQREALWLSFEAARWKPNAVKVGVGMVNAVSGDGWDEGLHQDPQDYMVCPDQPWLDGINAGDGFIRQFVAMPLGSGYTVEGQVTGEETFGGIQIVVFEPKPGLFPDAPPAPRYSDRVFCCMSMASPGVQEMGLAAGGRMRQQIYPDPHGIETWDPENRGSLFIHIVNSEQYAAITGQAPPRTPIDARTYTQHGYPWFDLYDEGRGDMPRSQVLGGVKSVGTMDAKKGVHDPAAPDSLEIPSQQVLKLPL